METRADRHGDQRVTDLDRTGPGRAALGLGRTAGPATGAAVAACGGRTACADTARQGWPPPTAGGGDAASGRDGDPAEPAGRGLARSPLGSRSDRAGEVPGPRPRRSPAAEGADSEGAL